MARPELLAPAGRPEAARAALQYGADAIYLGLPEFSARAEAENFTWDTLDEITAYAHAQPRPRKVYVAMNTLVLSREVERVVPALQRLAELQVDALIVQDAGLIHLARRHVPALALHASTQMTVHQVDGVRALARLGFTRVVPARELSLEEVGRLVRAGGLEVEIFIHGTLCYAYSGQCLFSSHATGRSGNRGRCTYGCRTLFSAGAQESLPFSMKDLALGDRLAAIRQSGVVSLKIEGRMKSPLYVAAVTDYYRRLLDGALTPGAQQKLEEDIRTIFSRPWTRLHADGLQRADEVIDGHTTGHRGSPIGVVGRVHSERDGDWLEFTSRRALEIRDGLQIDVPGQARPLGFAVDVLRAPGRRGTAITMPPGPVEVLLPPDHPELPAGATVYCSSSQEVKRRYPVDTLRPGVHRVRHPVRMTVQLSPEQLRVSGRAELPCLGEVQAEISLPGPFAVARQPGGTLAAARKAFDRLGETAWCVSEINLDDPAGCFVPASVWNEVRRQWAEAMTSTLARARERWTLTVPKPEPVAASGPAYWSLRLDQWPVDWTEADVAGAQEVVLPMEAEGAAVPIPVRLALPLLMRDGHVDEIRRAVMRALKCGQRRWEVSSWAGLEILRVLAAQAGLAWDELDLSGDWPLHVLNPYAAEQYVRQGLRHLVTSPEEEAQNVSDLLAVSGGRMWVLVAQFSPLFIAATGPAGLAGAPRLQSRGQDYVEVCEPDQHVLVARSAFWIAHHAAALAASGAGGYRVDFTRASAVGADLRALWKTARAGAPLPGSHEGNYRRGLK